MDPRTGDIFDFPTVEAKLDFEKKTGCKLVPITEKQSKEWKSLSNRKRKKLLNGAPCICGSGKSFKKCCMRKYK